MSVLSLAQEGWQGAGAPGWCPVPVELGAAV